MIGRSWPGHVFGLTGGAVIAVVLILGMAVFRGAQAERGMSVPTDPAAVVATLRVTGDAYPETLRTALRATRTNPQDAGAAKAAARALIDFGRSVGDSRLVGASLAVLRPFLSGTDAEALVLAATARQYQHDFNGALELLDRALALSPRDANARLIRATIHIVQGKFDIASADCREISGLPRPDLGFLCQATSLTLTKAAPAIYDRLSLIVDRPSLLDPALRGYAVGLMGEIADLQGNDDAARRHFAEVLQLAPDDIRIRLLLSDLLTRAGDDGGALALLTNSPPVDGVLIRRAILGARLHQPDVAGPAQTEMARRVAQNLSIGLTAHAREEAQYFMQVAPDPAMALARAKVNWALQHEIEDARLMIDAADRAGDPLAAKPVLDWMAAVGVSVPTLAIPNAVREAVR